MFRSCLWLEVGVPWLLILAVLICFSDVLLIPSTGSNQSDTRQRCTIKLLTLRKAPAKTSIPDRFKRVYVLLIISN
jgi:hypothetical protein